jgi:hemerythrin-like domain-containing protein
MNAIKLLKQDHEKMKRLFKVLEDSAANSPRVRQETFEKLRQEISLHEEIEEKVLYPALKAHPTLKDIVLEGFEEHHVVDVILCEIEGVPFGDETWMAKLKVMKENLEHHIEEEEDEMFPKAADEFSKEELESLGSRMEDYRQQLLESAVPKAA